MKRWKLLAVLLASLMFFCACGRKDSGAQTASPEQAPQQENLPEEPANTAPQTLTWDSLDWGEPLELTYAEQFAVDYADGYARIVIDNITHLLVPEGGVVPEGVPEDVVIMQQPLQNIYLQATAAMDSFVELGALDAITLSGTKADGWYIPAAREAMEAGRTVYAGKYSAPDYELIVEKL